MHVPTAISAHFDCNLISGASETTDIGWLQVGSVGFLGCTGHNDQDLTPTSKHRLHHKLAGTSACSAFAIVDVSEPESLSALISGHTVDVTAQPAVEPGDLHGGQFLSSADDIAA